MHTWRRHPRQVHWHCEVLDSLLLVGIIMNANAQLGDTNGVLLDWPCNYEAKIPEGYAIFDSTHKMCLSGASDTNAMGTCLLQCVQMKCRDRTWPCLAYLQTPPSPLSHQHLQNVHSHADYFWAGPIPVPQSVPFHNTMLCMVRPCPVDYCTLLQAALQFFRGFILILASRFPAPAGI